MEQAAISQRRYYRLQKAFSEAIHRGVQPAFSPQEVQALFADVQEVFVEALQELYGKVLKHIYANSKGDFDEYCVSEGVSEKLAGLEEVCQRQGFTDEVGAAAAPDKGTLAGCVAPRDAARSARVAAMRAEAEELRLQVEQAQHMGKALEEQLSAKQAAVTEAAARIEAVTAAMGESAELYQPWISGQVTRKLQPAVQQMCS